MTMAMSNAERQAAWRKRRQERILELERKVAKLERAAARPNRRRRKKDR
jgi:hypothetical protein